ncbi:MAG: hypothetical protein AB7P01_16355 [Bacteroidia bacterium]
MIDKSAIINDRVTKSGKDIAEIARRLNVDRGTIYYWLDHPDLPNDKIALLGLAINYDFSIDFPELKNHLFYFEDKQYIVGEPLPVYGTTAKEDIAELKKEISTLTQKVKALTKGATNHTKWQQAMDSKVAILQDTVNRLIKGLN